MMTSSNGNIFRVTGHLCGEFTGEFPTQRLVTRGFDIFLDLRLNKGLSKQSRGWWFETLTCPLWRQCNDSKLQMCTSFVTLILNWVNISQINQFFSVFPLNTYIWASPSINMSRVRHCIVSFVVYTQVHNLDANCTSNYTLQIWNRFGDVKIIGNAFP